MIALRDLGKNFNGTIAVDGINLTILPGEIVGLLGPNGAGKTTTLRMIAGVLPPSRGSVYINHLDIREDDKKIKSQIGYLPENNPLYDDQTTEEYLNYWSDIKGLVREKKSDEIKFVVDNCGISEVYYRPISELSKGYRQRVGIAQAILAKPKILILDEPTEGLDPNQRQEIQRLIKKMGEKKTVIISSHVLSEISKICNRLIIIHHGKVVADGSPDNLRHLGENTSLLEVEFKEKVLSGKIKDIPGVVEVTRNNSGRFLIKFDRNIDGREIVFKTAVKQKWTLLTMVLKERELEDVFSQLTKS